METERAPGIRALMTRGPEASTVRSNIVGMVQEPVRHPATTRHQASVGCGARYPDAVPVVACRPSRMGGDRGCEEEGIDDAPTPVVAGGPGDRHRARGSL